MAAIIYEGADPFNYLSTWFSKETYLRAYNCMLNLVKGQMFWPKSIDDPVQPPLVKRMPGRPAKKKRKEPLEGKNKTKLSRIRRTMRCSFCHQKGHTKLRCPTKVSF